MESDFAEALVCNGNKPSVEFGSEDVGDKEQDEEETNTLLRTTVNGGIVDGKGPKSLRRKVQWNDLNGNKLAEVLEFQPRYIPRASNSGLLHFYARMAWINGTVYHHRKMKEL